MSGINLRMCYFVNMPPHKVIEEAVNRYRGHLQDIGVERLGFKAMDLIGPDHCFLGPNHADLDAFMAAHKPGFPYRILLGPIEVPECLQIIGAGDYFEVNIYLRRPEFIDSVAEPFKKWARRQFYDPEGTPKRARIFIGHGDTDDWRYLYDKLRKPSILGDETVVPFETGHNWRGLPAQTIAECAVHSRTVAVFYVADADLSDPLSMATIGHAYILLEHALGIERVLLVMGQFAEKELKQNYTWKTETIVCPDKEGIAHRALDVADWIRRHT